MTVFDSAEAGRPPGESMSLMEYLRAEPYVDLELDIDRRRDSARDVTDVAGTGVPVLNPFEPG